MTTHLTAIDTRDVATPSRPSTNVVVVQMPQQSFSTWTVTTVKSALDEHELGTFASSAALVDSMGRDDRIKGTLGTRIKALIGKNGVPFSIQPSDSGNKGRVRTIAKQIAPLWWKICSDAAVANIIRDVVMLGVHLSRILWMQVDGMWLPQVAPVAPHNLYYDASGTGGPPGFYLQTLEKPVYIDPADPQWFLYAPAGERSWMEGAVRALGIPYMMRQFSYRDWVRYSEKHGMPILTIEEPADTPLASKAAFYARLAKLGSESVVRMPVNKDGQGFKLNMLEAKDSSWQGFDSFIARLDVAIAVVLLGQNMTTDPQANATGVHNARLVRQDYLDSDVQPLMTELREQIIKPWGRFNISGWDDDLAPWPTWDTRPPEDKTQRANMLISLGDAINKLSDVGIGVDAKALAEEFGVPLALTETPGQAGQYYQYHLQYGIVTKNEARAKLGLPPVPDGDVPPTAAVAPGGATSPAAAPAVPPAGAGPSGKKDAPALLTAAHLHAHERAESDAKGYAEGQAYADQVSVHAQAAAADLLAGDVEGLLALVEAAIDFGDLQKRIVAYYRDLDASDLADLTQKALVLAELAGRAAVLQDL
jgi:phage gp29-like protein